VTVALRTLVIRTERFSAGHRVYRPDWTDERNAAVFGKCGNPAGHGHNYTLEVAVSGPVDAETGYVFDLGRLRDLVRATIVDKVDHRNLNTDVDFLRGVNPTTENLAHAFWNELRGVLPPGTLHRIVLRETDNNAVEIRENP
jgi:6-pyruvoyltetrahydropterin/6-carboxytetrahydropterin synthase